MAKDKQIKNLRFTPRDQVFAARFTRDEATVIRKFCKKQNIKFSDILRYSIRKLIPNL